VKLLTGSKLPVADSAHAVDLVGGGGGTANRVALPRGTGYFVQTARAGAGFWVSDTGVRYGVDAENDSVDTVGALGLTPPPLPIPAAVLSLFADGPTLSRTDALIAHDSLAPTAQASRRIQESR
jgi:hypothetical protein